MRVFQEREKFILPTSVAIDINASGLFGRTAGFAPSNARISENSEVDSFWIHFDPIGTPANMTRIGTITFDQDILGIIVGVNGGINQTHPDNTLGLSNSVLGLPGIGYDFTITDLFPGGGDQISLSADRRTIGFTLISGPGSDNMRVITAVPEPTPFTLSFTTFMLLAIYRRNKQLTSNERLLGAR